MTIDPRAIQQWDAMMTELDKLIHQHEPVIEQEGSFLHIIEAISAEAVDNYHSLRQAYFNDAQTPIAGPVGTCLSLLCSQSLFLSLIRMPRPLQRTD